MQDSNISGGRIVFEPAANFVAIHVRQIDVERDQRGGIGARLIAGLRFRLRASDDLVAAITQVASERVANGIVVVDKIKSSMRLLQACGPIPKTTGWLPARATYFSPAF